ncbi:MAG: DNA primase, partial [Citrobacter freundii]
MIKSITIEKFRSHIDIVDVIGQFVKLKKQGTSHRGLCPFHQEKHASFSVSKSKGIYKCFSCQEAGDAFTFLMKHEGMDFEEAVTWLASRYGIEVEKTERSDREQINRTLRERHFLIQEKAAAYFEEHKQTALSYLEQRGISPDMIERFGLGYAPESGLRDHLLSQGFTDADLATAQVITLHENHAKDKFRNRVIFPIRTVSGRTLAFGGRTLSDDPNVPKYLNSAESEFYKKRAELYGLFEAKQAIMRTENCFLTEGYTDVIRLHQLGIEETVAPLGTSCTDDQARKLRRFTSKVTILTDGDEAGLKAASRMMETLLRFDFEVKFVPLPPGSDPDSFFR